MRMFDTTGMSRNQLSGRQERDESRAIHEKIQSARQIGRVAKESSPLTHVGGEGSDSPPYGRAL
jgi:hypothetical protein